MTSTKVALDCYCKHFAATATATVTATATATAKCGRLLVGRCRTYKSFLLNKAHTLALWLLHPYTHMNTLLSTGIVFFTLHWQWSVKIDLVVDLFLLLNSSNNSLARSVECGWGEKEQGKVEGGTHWLLINLISGNPWLIPPATHNALWFQMPKQKLFKASRVWVTFFNLPNSTQLDSECLSKERNRQE